MATDTRTHTHTHTRWSRSDALVYTRGRSRSAGLPTGLYTTGTHAYERATHGATHYQYKTLTLALVFHLCRDVSLLSFPSFPFCAAGLAVRCTRSPSCWQRLCPGGRPNPGVRGNRCVHLRKCCVTRAARGKRFTQKSGTTSGSVARANFSAQKVKRGVRKQNLYACNNCTRLPNENS